jgi:hypothetical protein
MITTGKSRDETVSEKEPPAYTAASSMTEDAATSERSVQLPGGTTSHGADGPTLQPQLSGSSQYVRAWLKYVEELPEYYGQAVTTFVLPVKDIFLWVIDNDFFCQVADAFDTRDGQGRHTNEGCPISLQNVHIGIHRSSECMSSAEST